MARRPGLEIEDWLKAERDDLDEEADRRFGSLLREAVPSRTPPRGFAGAVMRSWREAAASGRPIALQEPRWRRRLALSFLLAVGAALAAGLPAVLLDVGLRATSFRLVQGVLAAAVSVCSIGFDAAMVLLTVARAMAVAAASGPVLVLVAANLGLATMAWYGLSRLLINAKE